MSAALSAVVLIAAAALDGLFGDPPTRYHPVGWIGQVISCGERLIRPLSGAKFAGVITVGLVLAVTGGAAVAVHRAVLLLPGALQVAVLAPLAGLLLAGRSLAEAGLLTSGHLCESDLGRAKEAVGRMVGRDTDGMSPEDVVRAAVESVAENTLDGMVAPLFYLAVGGLTGLVLYKAVNTMDSMLGYKNDRYRQFGWAAARLDDAVNWLPARLLAPMWVAAALVCGLDARGACKSIIRDGGRHPSPNAGISEAAVAGAVGVQLGGTSRQGGRLRQIPRLGDPCRPVNWRRIDEAVSLSQVVWVMSAGFLAATVYFLG